MQLLSGIFLGACAFLLAAAYTAPAGANVDPGQLVGSWVHTTPADIDALEFTSAGKVNCYMTGSDALQADFAVGDDGRLSMTMGGQVTFYAPTLNGDQLELKDPASGNVTEYRRLKPGETVAGALAGQAAADQQAIADRNAAIPEFLKSKDLVMVIENPGQGAPNPCALEFVPTQTGWQGQAIYDGKPLHAETLTAQMQQSDAASLVVAFGVTPNNPNGQTQITFRPAGTAPNITLTAQVNFGEMFNQGGNSTAVIKVDHDMRKQILDHFKAEVDRLNALKAPIIAMLKDYAVLNGTSQAMYPADKAGFTDQITLSRSPQNNTWIGQAQITSRSTGVSDVFPVMAGVGIVGDKVALQILSQKRVYQFDDIDASAGKLTGAWQMPNYPNGHPAELSVTQAIDAKDRDQFFAASKAAIQKLDSAAVYHAIINDLSDNNQPPNPVSISLGAGADGSITGTAVYPLYGATMTLSGKEVDTPLGPQLQIQYTGGTADAAASPNAAGLINAVQHEVWLLSPAIQSTGAAAGAMRFTGYGLQNRNMPPFTIELIPYTDADKAAVTLALNTGVKFQLHHPIMPPEATDIIELSADPASGGITGHLTTAGHQLNTPPDVTFTGPIADQSGYAQLTMPIMRKIIKSPVYSYDLLVTPTDQGLYLTGYCYNIRMGANRPLGRWDAVEVK